ncbi:MAG: BatD family protein [Chthoniobacteraceae bacterium]
MRFRNFLPLLLIAGVLLGWHVSSAHAEVSVNVALDSSQVDVGETATLQLTVSGADNADDPKIPSVAHLQIQAVGRQTSYNASLSFGGGNSITQQLIFSYSVTADQAGNYTIPAITVSADGKSYSSNPVSLIVGGGSTGQNSSQPSGKGYFAQIVVPKTNAYVGESLPVEVKYFIDGSIPIQAAQDGPPSLETSGLTAPKLRLGDQGQADYQGRPYRVIVFKTVVTPVKAGALQVGPSSFVFVMQLPQHNRRRSSPFGNSPFQQFFGDDDIYDMVPRQVTVTADAAPLQAKPLPTAGRPTDFSGAVGDFKIVGQSSTSEVKAGEPLTVTVTISGRGNFDRITAPQLESAPGWRSYPATSSMKTDDDSGLSGTKTFQISLVPSGGQTEVPPLHFSYFDPEREKYITLSTDKIPVKVDGSIATPTPTPIVATAATPAANASPAPAVDRDILYILPSAQWDRSAFTPIYRTTGFWVAQMVPLSALLGFALFQRSRRQAGDERANRLRTLSKQSEEQKAQWQQQNVARGQFYEAATAWMRTVSAIRHGGEPDALSGNEILARSGLDDATQQELKSLFDQHGEMLYAGGTRSEEPLPENRRNTLVDALNSFEKQP